MARFQFVQQEVAKLALLHRRKRDRRLLFLDGFEIEARQSPAGK
jgi:hypothetical protein